MRKNRSSLVCPTHFNRGHISHVLIMKIGHFLLCILIVIGIVQSSLASFSGAIGPDDPYAPEYVIAQDTIPIQPRTGDFINNPNSNPFDLNDPAVIEQNVEYDPVSGNYIITETIGGEFYRPPTYMTFEEYYEYQAEQQEQQYFEELGGFSDGSSSRSGLKDPIDGIDIKKNLIDRLFGGSAVDIKPQGQIGLTFGVDFQKVENPSLTLRQQRQGGFDFDMDIRLNVTGKIGEKLNLSTNYNTQATFDFDNQLKLSYDSEAFSDDDIVKNIEAGNVSLPLKGSLIQGSQSLFGIKTDLQFGHLGLTVLASQQKSRRQDIQIQGGAQFQEFEVRADEYDENRHFFLTHYNRRTFEKALDNLPQVNTLFKINRIEVWVTNDRNDPDNVRDIVALADLGESLEITNSDPRYQLPASPRYPDINGELGLPGRPLTEGGALVTPDANDLYTAVLNNGRTRNLDDAVSVLSNVFGQRQSRDFEKVSARQLSSNEYTYHPELGFISVNVNLQADQILGVAFEYDYNGKTYKVGEFANESYSPDSLGVLFVKMLKSTTQRIDLPTWDLMMKNVYSVGAFQVNQQDFKLDIFYEDPGKGEKRFLPDSELAGEPLLQVFNLDNLNVLGDPCPDGVFDFVPGVTINPRNGRIMFPVLEPFSNSLSDRIASQRLKDKYDYFVLYDSTIVRAREYQDLNRFTIRGNYKSSVSSEISLGSFNLPPGSVTVRAGGQTLQEGSDYEVDYNIGRVKILNDSYLSSGLPINVSFEDNTLFGFQTKTLLGVRADYEVNENFNIGGTYLHLFERPFTQKVNVGDDPINNRIYGLDVNFSTKAPWLTRAVDFLPFIETKEESNISISAEAAVLKPGHARAINQRDPDGDKNNEGVVYLDDFEGSTSSFDLRTPANNWVLASVPQNDEQNNNPLFPESELIDNTLSGVNRALLNWYRIDQSVRSSQDNGNPYTAAIPQIEVFPNVTVQPGLSNIIQTLDMTYYPDERGPYNFDIPGGTPYSQGLRTDGKLVLPETRWAGIMRSLNTNDFQAANIEYLEFWMLDPYLEGDDNPGDLYINIGNVSEDILRDSRKFFENGLPTTTRNVRVDETNWGNIPRAPQITNSFVNDVAEREQQDVGLDGLSDDAERSRFDEYLNTIQGGLNPAAFDTIQADPSNDNYRYFRAYEEDTPIFERYRRFNMPEGNTGQPEDGRPTSSTNLPDSEDINRDNTLSETESYFQYKVPLKNEDGDPIHLDADTNPFITDQIDGGGRRWYRFKIPLDQYTSKVGSIQDFRSIRFIRMYMHGFEDEITLRFARLELVRNQWRRYMRDIEVYRDINDPYGAGPYAGDNNVVFDVNAVNIEENGDREPFEYVLPPGIQREQSTNTTFPDILQNEQSLSMEICHLKPREARAIYKNIIYDLRLYKRLKMFVHAEASSLDEAIADLDDIEDGDLGLMLRIGSDFQNNYYEYEIPLVMSRDTSYGPTTEQHQEEVWKAINNIDISIEQFKNVKRLRNSSADPDAFNTPFEVDDIMNIGGVDRIGKLRVRGNPNLGNVKGVMIGIVNRSEETHCAEIWLNELRLSGLDERGGFAAIAKIDANLADFGTATIAGNYSTIGWGGLEEKLNDRAREEVIQIDAAANAELGKFFGKKSGIKIPFYAQYSQTTRIPEFDPYDLDIPLKEKLSEVADPRARDSVRNQAIDFTEIKGYNFTNVRKERTGGKNSGKTPMPWNIENFAFNYAYTKTTHHDPIISKDEISQYNGGFDYKYTRKAKFITPFKKIFKKDKYVKLISEFNFNPLPNTFEFNTTMNRQFQETSYRFTELAPQYNTFFNKQFTWDRNYKMNWDITKGLKTTFNALNYAVIDELKAADEPDPEVRKQHIVNNLKEFGRTKNYDHFFTVNYTLPFKKIPLLDFITVKAQYRGEYTWSAAALNTTYLGNVIQNGQRRQLTGDLNFETLYNKSKYLKKINGKERKRNRRGAAKSGRSKGKEDSKDGKGKDGKDKKKGKDKDKEPSKMEKALIRPLMLLRKAKVGYTETFATVIPGYQNESKALGQTPGFDAPGWAFISGLQPNIANDDVSNDYLTRGANKGWFVDTVLINQQVTQNYTQTIDAQISIEPIKDFRIDLEADRSFTENRSLYFKDTLSDGIPDIRHVLPREVGSFSMSYYALNTLFNDDIIGLFQDFEANRSIISKRLAPTAGAHPIDGPDFREGYGKTQLNVLLPAFLAAYTEQDANTVDVDADDYTKVLFKQIPKPNWSVSYDGLAKTNLFKDIFSKFTLTHGYASGLTVNSYNTDSDGFTGGVDLNQNLFSRFEIPQIVIDEQFSPLLGIQMELQNGISMDLDFRKSRNLQMSFITYQLAETKTSEYVFGFGYTMRDVNIGFLTGSKKKKKKKRPGKTKPDPNNPGAPKTEEKGSDLNVEFNFSLRDDITINHLLDQGVAEPTRGLRQIQFSPSVDYDINKRLNVRLFFDYSKTTPKTSASFPITNTRGGVTVTFSLE